MEKKILQNIKLDYHSIDRKQYFASFIFILKALLSELVLVLKCSAQVEVTYSHHDDSLSQNAPFFLCSVPREDMYAQDSIELLTTSGIQFKKHEDEGIDTLYFAELLMTSGVVLCEGVKWLSFHR